MSLRIFFIFILTGLLLITEGCSFEKDWTEAEPKTITNSQLLLHTVVTLRAEGAQAEAGIQAALAELSRLEALTDPSLPDSDIARLNAAAGKGPVQVSPDTFHLLEVSRQLAQLTEGAFDPTLLPVSHLYGFGTDSPRVPSPEELQVALTKTGWQRVRLDRAARTAELAEEGMAVDLGAAAKGMAADKVRQIFHRHGLRGLCSFGSSTVVAIGKKADGSPWQIGLKHPRQTDKTVGTVELSHQVLSVSGDYERFFLQDGRRYHHLINPANGLPAEGVQSVAVICDAGSPDAGLWSDMLSTACFILGKEKTERLTNSLPVKVRYIFIPSSSPCSFSPAPQFPSGHLPAAHSSPGLPQHWR